MIVLGHIGALHRSFNVPYSWTAVDLFFVLSGFLITSILLRHEPTGPFFASFYACRGLRIWPIYYLSLLALAAINPWLPEPYALDGMPKFLTYTQTSFMYCTNELIPGPLPLDHTWTLAIEEQFYLLWPALVFLAGRKRLVALASGVIVLSVAARLAGYREFILLTRCDGFAIGGLLALALDDHAWATRNRSRLRVGFVAMGGLALAYLAWHIVLSPGTPKRWAGATSSCALICAFTTLYASIVGLVVIHSGDRLLAPLRTGWLCYLGRIGYGLYLYHQIIQVVLDDALQARGIHYPPWLQATIFAASIATAAASWRFLEQPILAWKDRFPYEKAPANVPSPAPGVAEAG